MKVVEKIRLWLGWGPGYKTQEVLTDFGVKSQDDAASGRKSPRPIGTKMKLTAEWTKRGMLKAILITWASILGFAYYLSKLSREELLHLFEIYERYNPLNNLSWAVVLLISISVIFSWFYSKTQSRLEDFEPTKLIRIICAWLGFAYLMAIVAGRGFLKTSVFGITVNPVSMTVSILISVIGLIAIWGLWKFEYWAWMTVIVLQVFSVIITMLNYKASSLQVIISYTLIPMAIIVILFEERDIFQNEGV